MVCINESPAPADTRQSDSPAPADKPAIVGDAEWRRLIEECVTDYAIFTINEQGCVAHWNAGAERILGYRTAEVLGLSISVFFTAEDQARGVCEQEQRQARDTGRAEDERWHVRKDGSRFWASGILTALHTASGELRGYVKILRDRSLLHEAQVRQEADQTLLIRHERHAATLRERSRMAQELHDTLAQGLTGITMQLSLAEQALREDHEEARLRIRRARDIARHSLVEARGTVQALLPHALQTQDLCSALRQLAAQIAADSGNVILWEPQGTPFPLLPEADSNLYRIVQEALTNAVRYAQATQIIVTLVFAPEQALLRVHDDGIGFDALAAPQGGGFGMTSMRERAEQIGGRWSLVSLPGQGTTVEVSLPLA